MTDAEALQNDIEALFAWRDDANLANTPGRWAAEVAFHAKWVA